MDEVKIEAKIDIEFEPSIKNGNTLLLKRPVDKIYPVSSPFGWRINPFKKDEKKFHSGIDFSVPVGTDVYAMADGFVSKEGGYYYAGWENDKDQKQGFGLRIRQEVIIDGKSIYIWYGHLSEILIKPVEFIRIGQLIAKSGNTGSSTGPHLHVQARQKDTGILFDMVFHG